jgi:hypothetical protein
VVTAIPCDGSAPVAPLPGAIVTSGPVGDGLADALGFALEEPAEAVPLPLPVGLTMVVVLVVQAVSASPSTAAKTAPETVLIRLMSPPFPGMYGMYATSSPSLYEFPRTKTTELDVYSSVPIQSQRVVRL